MTYESNLGTWEACCQNSNTAYVLLPKRELMIKSYMLKDSGKLMSVKPVVTTGSM